MNAPARGSKLKKDIDAALLPPGAVALWYLGQSGFVVKGAGTILYIDPYLSDFLVRFTKGRADEDPRRLPPPLLPGDIDNADYYFGSHWHYDHIDPDTVSAIAAHSPRARFVVPACARPALVEQGIPAERFVDSVTDVETDLGDLSFVSIPAAHESFDLDPGCGYPYQGYILTVNGVTIYHAGDCIPYDGLVARLAKRTIDIALLPINGRDYFRRERGFAGNFSYREAAELAAAANAAVLIPMHFGMHMANTERPGLLADYLCDHFPYQKFHIMTPGEEVLYLKQRGSGVLALQGEKHGSE